MSCLSPLDPLPFPLPSATLELVPLPSLHTVQGRQLGPGVQGIRYVSMVHSWGL